MNQVQLIGRFTKDPDVRYTKDKTAVANYTLAVDRRYKKDGEQDADFINVVAFGRAAEFVEKYFLKGMKIGITGRIQTGSYEKNGHKVYTFEIVAENQEFVERKEAPATESDNGFMPVPEDQELPFT